MISLCPPALIYVIFSLTQIIIDTIKGLYNTAFFKFIVSIFITILLNALCRNGLSVISWIIVFIPFIFMTFIVALLLYIFGLDAATGKLKLPTTNTNQGGNLVFSTNVNTEPVPSATTTSTSASTSASTVTATYNPVPESSSDPAYESFVKMY